MYNDFVKSASDPAVNYDDISSGCLTTMTCKLVGFLSSGEGKFPSDGWERHIVVNDFQNFLPKLFESTTFVNDASLPQGWKDYIMNTPNISS